MLMVLVLLVVLVLVLLVVLLHHLADHLPQACVPPVARHDAGRVVLTR